MVKPINYIDVIIHVPVIFTDYAGTIYALTAHKQIYALTDSRVDDSKFFFQPLTKKDDFL